MRSQKTKSSKQLRYAVEYALYRLFAPLIRSLPAGGVFRLGRLLGALGYVLAGKRKRIARLNLDIAFGEDKTSEQKERIIRESFIQLAVSGLQFLWIENDPRHKVRRLIPQPPAGLDELKRCLARGKGVLFLTAHYSNWEAMGVHHGCLGVAPLHSMARRLDNPRMEALALRLRTSSGNGIFYKEQSPLKIVRLLRNNGCVAVMMDQNMAKGGAFVDFFGKKAATARSIAVLSYATGAPILPLFSRPAGDGTYAIQYGPELILEKTGDKEADILRWTQQCQTHIESVIRARPEPWMWGHRRWKMRPPEEQGVKIYPG